MSAKNTPAAKSARRTERQARRSDSTKPQVNNAINAKLDAIYAQLPEIECRGLCHEECSAIIMTPAERQRIRADSGIHIPDTVMDGPNAPGDDETRQFRIAARLRGCIVDEDYKCPALTAENRCSVYEHRPLICRAYGLTRLMQCHYGCQPSRWLSEDEWDDLNLQAMKAGGVPGILGRLR